MRGHPVSYRDPLYDGIDSAVTSSLGLPDGLLTAIRTKGERSNSDAVSSAGARTVYQVTPATRKLALDKWGVDAYLSAENAAEVAGRLLKDSLDRTGGDVKEAVTQYVAGTGGRRGPVTQAYVNRVTGAGAPAPGSATERLINRGQGLQDSAMIEVLARYQRGEMNPREAADFEQSVKSGQAVLPDGVTLDKVSGKPAPYTLSEKDLAKFADPATSDVWRKQAQHLVDSGEAVVPAGAKLTPPANPADRSFAEGMGRGVRNAMTGLGGLVDIGAGPIASGLNLATMAAGGQPTFPTAPGRQLANSAADALGLKAPETPIDKLVAGGSEGAVGGMLTAGAGAALQALPGAAGAVGRVLAASPGLDTASGASSGLSSAAAANAGGGFLAQTAAGLAGGLAPVGAAGAARAVAPKARAVVESTPREVILDSAGKLTDEGREVSARQGVSADELKQAYDAPAPPEAKPQTVRTYEGKDYPVEVIDPTPVADAEGVPHVKVRAETGEEGFVPQNEIRTVEAAPEASAAPAAEAPGPAAAKARADEPLPATAAARVADATSEGIPLSKAEATQDFAAQERENNLAASGTAEGENVRQFRAQRQEKIAAAIDNFRSAFGDPSLTATERGTQVKEALRELKDQGKAGVTALYERAKEAVASLGEAGQEVLKLDTAPILSRMREIFIDEGVDPQVRAALRQQAAKHGLIGENPRTVEGETTVSLRDSAGEPAGKITFTGPVEPLTIVNAENLRQKINALFDKDSTGAAQTLKPLIDDAVSAAVEHAAETGPGGVGQAFKDARAAYREQRANFNAKDIVQRSLDKKTGTATDALNPEAVIREVFAGGPEGLTNLRRMKARLLSTQTESGRAAWQAIQAHGMADIFNKAIGPGGQFSGLRLNAAIKKFGPEKLKVLLSEADFNRLMKLRRVIETATVPISGTTNPSGSGYRVVNFLAQHISSLANLGKAVPLARDTIKGAEEFLAGREAKKTAADVTDFTPEKAAQADAPKPQKAARARSTRFVSEFLQLASSERLLGPALAGAPQRREAERALQ